MSGHEDAPAIKLYTNKKEQETYENLAGPPTFSDPQSPHTDECSMQKQELAASLIPFFKCPASPFPSFFCLYITAALRARMSVVRIFCVTLKSTSKSCAPADLFAIVKTTEKLERAYVRDTISAKDYEPLCEKLIAQFRTLWETLRDTVSLLCLLP